MHFLGPLVITGGDGSDVLLRGSTLDDVVTGGAGDDRIEGNDGVDSLDGGPGNDTITAGGGNDLVVGGPGSDALSGSSENDTIRADDQEADSSINGGPGTDSAYYDNGLDPTPLATENRFPVDPPPPPPPPAGACSYDSASRTVSAQIPAGATAVLKVVGSEIWFGAPTAAACPGATTANTDGITITGGAGTLEQLTIDQSGGAFAPGFTAETGSSEIEITTVLGEAGDAITILGTTGDDSISIGTNGAALNADGDVDLTFSPAPATVEVRGLGGVNVLSARAGFGAGQPFAGLVRLYAGDSGDTLRGSAGGDLLVGGAGPDRLEGWEGNDRLEGVGGNDNLIGSDGDDEVIGGAGADLLSGGAGNDTLRADDDEADAGINGNQGIDTAYYDAGIDPTPLATENRIPAYPNPESLPIPPNPYPLSALDPALQRPDVGDEPPCLGQQPSTPHGRRALVVRSQGEALAAVELLKQAAQVANADADVAVGRRRHLLADQEHLDVVPGRGRDLHHAGRAGRRANVALIARLLPGQRARELPRDAVVRGPVVDPGPHPRGG